jgi:IclR family transcriptional regulator, acetate operon repressor
MPPQLQRKSTPARFLATPRHGKRNHATAAAARALTILRVVSACEHGQSAAELAPKVDLPAPTVLRLARQLEEAGYLQREPGSKRFIAGHALTAMAINTLIHSPQREARQSILRALVDDVQQSCSIAATAGDSVVLIDSIGVGRLPPAQFERGARQPLHCTASGKLFLSLMPTRVRRQLITSAPLRQFTDQTLVDPLDIERALKRIRSTGVGVDQEEFLEGLVGVAVPVFDTKGRIVAAVAMQAQIALTELKYLLTFVPALTRASVSIGKILNT